TSRRFNVEIQPQLVLLQKTLLNVEGMGRELDPALDLWKTAKPYLENWMRERVGLAGLRKQLDKEAAQWSQLLPQIPRLVHAHLSKPVVPHELNSQVERLLRTQEHTNRVLMALCAILAVGI